VKDMSLKVNQPAPAVKPPSNVKANKTDGEIPPSSSDTSSSKKNSGKSTPVTKPPAANSTGALSPE